MDPRTQLLDGIELLGSLLTARKQQHDLVVIGGATLLLLEVIHRPTLDIDAVALSQGGALTSANPLPTGLLDAVREVGRALGLPAKEVEGKDCLNAGPAILLKIGLPEGFADRLHAHTTGGLTLWLPSLQDLVALKLWAATSVRRGARRKVDLSDLRAIGPSVELVRSGLEWCARLDGRPDFWEIDARPVILQLGLDPSEVIDG